MKRIALLTALALPLAAASVPARDDDSKPNRLPRAIKMIERHLSETPKNHAALSRALDEYNEQRARGDDERAQQTLRQIAVHLFDEYRTCKHVLDHLQPYVNDNK